MRPNGDFPPRMKGATGSVAGRRGLVPKPTATDNVKYLKGDGSWSALTNASAATNAEAAAGTSTSVFLTPATAAIAAAPARNALAPRGGLAFDGTIGSRVYSTLTNQSIGTDAFSLHAVFKMPSVPVSTGPAISIGASASTVVANNAACWVSGADLRLYFRDGLGGSCDATVVGAQTAFSGKVVHLTVVRNLSGAPTVYLNAVAQTLSSVVLTSLTWQYSITSTYMLLGFLTSSDVSSSTIYSVSLYNLALAQADVTEIHELGGAVPERFKFGSQVARYTSGFSAGLDGWHGSGGGYPTLTCSGNVDTSADGASIPPSDDWQRADQSGTGRVVFYSADAAGLAVYRKTMRITGSIFIPLGSAITHMTVGFEVLNTTNEGWINTGLGYIAGAVVTLTPGSVTNFDVTAINTVPGSTRALFFVASNGAGSGQNYTAQKAYLKNVVVRQVGAVVHYDADLDGIGYQLHDQSTNKLDAVVTTTGTSWTKPARRGFVRGTLTWAGTHEAKSLIGQSALPPEAYLQLVTVRPSASTSGSGLLFGTSSDNGRFVASAIPLTATQKKAITLYTPLPATGSTAGSSDLNLTIDPDMANYSGSIEVEAHYAVTEGSP